MSLAALIARLSGWPRRLLAAGCLVLAAGSLITARQRPPAAATEPVVVAAHPLPAGRTLASGDLHLARWPAGLPPPGAAHAVAPLVGRRLAGPVGVGEPIGPERLIGGELTAGLPVGTVAATVAIDGATATGLVRAGDYIDLLLPPADNDLASSVTGPGGDPTAAVVLARDVLVLAVVPPPGAAGDAAGVVVVAVDDATALRLAGIASRVAFATVRNPP